jgi:hypothetical protein
MMLGDQPTICRRTTRSLPGLKKMAADASGFAALAPEGRAGTSQELPAAETAVMAVSHGSIAARSRRTCELDQSRSAQFGSAGSSHA